MSASVRVLDFFVVEATEYVDQLDAVLSHPAGTPDLDALAVAARRLRGSATMARQTPIADLAGGIEGVVRALRGGTVTWDQATTSVLVATVDDLRILLRGARSWSVDEDRRAAARIAELARVAPPVPRTTPSASTAQGGAFLARETAELARALDHFVAGTDDSALATVADRVRSLRGVADVRDLPPLPDVLETLEGALKSLALGAHAPPSPRQKTLLAAASAVLRRVARDLATSGRPDAGMPEMGPFAAAADALAEEMAQADRVVPVDQLFFADGGPHVVSTAPNPPTSMRERFRLEVVSLAEHLRGVVAEARANPGPDHRDRIARELRGALRALGGTANSFGERLVARFAAEWSVRVSSLDGPGLAALDEAASLLADPAITSEQLAQGLERLAEPRHADSASRQNAAIGPRRTPLYSEAVATPPTAAPAGTPAAPPSRERVRTPTGPDLQAYLEDGISGLRALETRPLSPPAQLAAEEIVPIENLLYSGRRALERAAQLRADLHAAHAVPSRDAVQELFDLVELALDE